MHYRNTHSTWNIFLFFRNETDRLLCPLWCVFSVNIFSHEITDLFRRGRKGIWPWRSPYHIATASAWSDHALLFIPRNSLNVFFIENRRWTTTPQQHNSGGRGPKPRRRRLPYRAVCNRETTRYFVIVPEPELTVLKRGCGIQLCKLAVTSRARSDSELIFIGCSYLTN